MATPPYQQTIATVRASLIEVFDEMDGWFDEPAGLRALRPSEGEWSVDEVLEHVTLTNHYLMLVLRKGCERAVRRAARGCPVPEGESDLGLLDLIGRRGSFPWARPEHMVPTGMRPMEEVRSLMREQVRGCLEILARLGGGKGALHRVRMSVNDSGRLDLYQWIYFLAQHARRHLSQMAANEVAWRAATKAD
jgi:hypothetical protein